MDWKSARQWSKALDRIIKKVQRNTPEYRLGYEEGRDAAMEEAADHEGNAPEKGSGLLECFCCGERAVICGGDNSFEDYCMEGEGIVGNYHCSKCGAEYLCFTRTNENSPKIAQDVQLGT